MPTVKAVDMAKEAGIDPKRFRQALRDERFSWHAHNERWIVKAGSDEHKAMQSVLHKISS
jgi:3-hydroxyisobutyrate dehydrogenase-like beta-hydroxyacid dehydrogenase